MELEGRIVAVTGATGFLGRHVVEELRRRGARVRAVVRNPKKAAFAGDVELAEADLSDRAAMARAFAGADAVIANAALSTRLTRGWEEFVEANAKGSENVVGACADAGVQRIVNVSTAAVYQASLWRKNGLDTPLFDHVAGPGLTWNRITTNWKYTWSKARGEAAARRLCGELGLKLTVVRPGPIYGPHDRKIVPRYARMMGWPVLLAPTVRVPHVHAGDVAVAIAGALANDATIGRCYHVTGTSVSLYEIFSTWKRIAGRGPVLIPVPVPVGMVFDDGDAERDLGYRARSIEEGLRDVLAHPIPPFESD